MLYPGTIFPIETALFMSEDRLKTKDRTMSWQQKERDKLE
jgi:hypothetical protein